MTAEGDVERALWCAVLDQARRDIQYTAAEFNTTGTLTRGYMDMLSAKSWVGSRDYREVCSLAGLDPDWLLPKFQEWVRESDEHWRKRQKRAA